MSGEAVTCPPETCICCLCVLRRSEEFGQTFDVGDKCCAGCHDEMAVPEWPGNRCPTTPPVGGVGETGEGEHG